MCKDISEEQFLLLEKIEDPGELRKSLEVICECKDCSCRKSPESRDYDNQCCIRHQVNFRNRLLHILNKMGL